MRLAHLADVHLGFRQFHRATPQGINQREADVGRAFRLAVDAVVEARPDAIVIAGDLFHSVRPTNTAIVFAWQQLHRLRTALPTAPIVVIAGNHDTPRSVETGSILRLYEQLGIDVALDDPRRFDFPALDLSVLAVPHRALGLPDRPVFRPAGSARHQVLLLHGEVEGVYPPEISGAAWGGLLVERSALHADDWSYIALGHYHVQHQVEPRAWYAGSLEYVTSNPWGELRDEERRGVPGKGWLLADVARGTVVRHAIAPARRVLDLPPIYGEQLTAAELDRRILERLDAIPGGWADQVVRQVVFDVLRETARQLDHATVRRVKAEALHYQLDVRRPESVRGLGVEPGGRRQPLAEVIRNYLVHRPLPAELDRTTFVHAGVALLEAVTQEDES